MLREVRDMNKKEAVAYAQVTLNFMQSTKYKQEINLQNFGLEMRQAFKIYPKSLVLGIADSQIQAEKKLQDIKSGCDKNNE